MHVLSEFPRWPKKANEDKHTHHNIKPTPPMMQLAIQRTLRLFSLNVCMHALKHRRSSSLKEKRCEDDGGCIRSCICENEITCYINRRTRRKVKKNSLVGPPSIRITILALILILLPARGPINKMVPCKLHHTFVRAHEHEFGFGFRRSLHLRGNCPPLPQLRITKLHRNSVTRHS